MSRHRKQDILVVDPNDIGGDSLTMILDHDGKYIHVDRPWLFNLICALERIMRDGPRTGQSHVIERKELKVKP